MVFFYLNYYYLNHLIIIIKYQLKSIIIYSINIISKLVKFDIEYGIYPFNS